MNELAWFGLSACLCLLGGILLSMKGFIGMDGEIYSPFNHFISELGDRRFAEHKNIFAASLIIGGVLLIPFIIGLGSHFETNLSNLLKGFGIFCAVSCCLVGCFPEDKVKVHFIVASCFFVGVVLLILAFSIAISIQPTALYPPWVFIASVTTLAIVLSFIINTLQLSKKELARTNEPWAWENGRPRFWLNPFLEWCAFLAIMGWFLMVVLLAFLD